LPSPSKPNYQLLVEPIVDEFSISRWLQEVFDCPLVIQLTDDEKFLVKSNLTIPDVKKFAISNTKDIIAIGFKPEKTFIFSDLDYVGGAFFENVVKIARNITLSQAKGTFGFTDAWVPITYILDVKRLIHSQATTLAKFTLRRFRLLLPFPTRSLRYMVPSRMCHVSSLVQ
jgi:hypothetical protein